MVIGPTPPGTGVIAPATSATSANATSPTMRDLPSAPAHAVDADVDHGRARLDPIAPHHLRASDGREHQVGAAADRRQIARLGMRDRHGGVLRRAAAAPAACRRCWSGRSRPPRARRATAARVLARTMQPSGVQGASAGRPGRQAAGIHRMEAVDVLGRIDRGDAPSARRSARGSGSCTRMPCTVGSALSRPISVSSSASLRRRRQPVIERPHAAADGHLHLAADIDSRSPDCCRRARPRAPARCRGRAPAGARRRRPCRAGPPRSPCRR